MKRLMHIIKRWFYEEDALAATEASFIFPIMLTLLLGLYDVGNGILANQKTIRASQVVADLMARENTVSTTDIDEAIEAGSLAFEPMSDESYGIDIVSISFDENAAPEIEWRETRNMSPVDSVLTDVAALAEPNEGVVMVSVQYTFEPVFAGFIVDTFEMQERAFSRGRSNPVVSRE